MRPTMEEHVDGLTPAELGRYVPGMDLNRMRRVERVRLPDGKCSLDRVKLDASPALMEAAEAAGIRQFIHRGGGHRTLIVSVKPNGIGIGVQGALRERLLDQKRIGRQRHPGE